MTARGLLGQPESACLWAAVEANMASFWSLSSPLLAPVLWEWEGEGLSGEEPREEGIPNRERKSRCGHTS